MSNEKKILGYIVRDDNYAAREWVREPGNRRKVLMRGKRVTVFPTVEKASAAISATHAWATKRGIHWADKALEWKIVEATA
jgi:hypothetical protein